MHNRLLLALASLAMLVVPGGVNSLAPAQANGAGAFQFVAMGTLPEYPTNGAIRQASMSGSLTGNAQVTGSSGSRLYTANFTLKAAPFADQPIQYQVDGFPYCLAASQAAGSLAYGYTGIITIDSSAAAGQVAGQVYVSGDTVLGGITRSVITFRFTYQRAAAGAVIVVNPATVTLYWQSVTGATGSFSTGFTGAGPAVVQYTDAAGASQACALGPRRPVGFTVTGNIEGVGA
ncbi:MAG TPA: hypothetical protein VM938_06960 [Acidimicrobiales bacterium]|nr:hypothetical protein [Acidimicrobiales bacterium]